jgi:uncharacterized protein (UPF0333 family)
MKMDKKEGFSFNKKILFKSKRSQMEMSFGFIFSMILIVVFIVVAFIAIKAFLGVQCNVGTSNFLYNLQQEVDRIYAGAGEDTTFKGTVSGNCKIDYICFFNPEIGQSGKFTQIYDDLNGNVIGGHNLYFYPIKQADIPSIKLNHINMTSFDSNPHCVNIENGVINLNLQKNSDEVLVRVS